jgi:hypothetical protein
MEQVDVIISVIDLPGWRIEVASVSCLTHVSHMVTKVTIPWLILSFRPKDMEEQQKLNEKCTAEMSGWNHVNGTRAAGGKIDNALKKKGEFTDLTNL